jgi:hypothetical protein
MELLAKQFNLSQQQAQLALEALLPAFSQGLKRNTSDPYGLGDFLNAMASGQHAKYFEDAGKAFSQQGADEGNGILSHLFGSKDLSRAVAAQAAQATGIGQQVLQQMLPVIASMIMGGLAKQSTSQMPAGNSGDNNNPLADIIEQMMKQGGLGGMLGGGTPAGGQAAPQQQQNPFDNNPLGKVLQDMFGGGSAQPQTQGSSGANPWGKILEDMLGGGGRQEAQPEGSPAPDGGPKNPYDDIFGKMFETGRQQRDDYQKGVESIFEQFRKGMDR